MPKRKFLVFKTKNSRFFGIFWREYCYIGHHFYFVPFKRTRSWARKKRRIYRYFWNKFFLHEFLCSTCFFRLNHFQKYDSHSEVNANSWQNSHWTYECTKVCDVRCGILAITIYSNLREIKFTLAPFDTFIEQKSTSSQPKCMCVCMFVSFALVLVLVSIESSQR